MESYPRVSQRALNRWGVAYTLVHNSSLVGTTASNLARKKEELLKRKKRQRWKVGGAVAGTTGAATPSPEPAEDESKERGVSGAWSEGEEEKESTSSEGRVLFGEETERCGPESPTTNCTTFLVAKVEPEEEGVEPKEAGPEEEGVEPEEAGDGGSIEVVDITESQ